MKELFESLVLPPDHYLKLAKVSGSSYLDDFLIAMSNLKSVLSAKEFNVIWNDKMQLKKIRFDEKAFIQSACEVAVANYFHNRKNFKIEVKVNPQSKKDVDCQFTSNGFTYNIEVKCATFDAIEEIKTRTNSFFFGSFGRIPDHQNVFQAMSNLMEGGLAAQGKPPVQQSIIKNMDNNLKEYLESAHSKFNSDCQENEINVLLVGCNDSSDMENWKRYLQFTNGLFTLDSFADHRKYNNVDVVVLTNLYFKHKDFSKKQIEDSWNLSKTLSLFMWNPLRAKEKIEGLTNFSNEIVNYNDEINNFKIEGDSPSFIKEQFRIQHFVHSYLEKQKKVYLFESPQT